ncbi:MAG: heme ABC exporter, ATP-binding protein CcmA [SAR202 cluster bacterium Io17-Chloro-G4]|nr:MAG: heme ABC exporter, ATP-binding protein CcmA [SAR202 cluster bacterium Io17-Chloro-G4]
MVAPSSNLGASAPAPTSGEAIVVRGLEKSFGEWPVLWNLDLTVGWGELVALFGANGVGKTTLLRILSTQAKPDAGSIQVAGFGLSKNAQTIRRRVGVVAHQTFLYEDLSCRENLVHYGRLYGLEDPRNRAEEALLQLGLSNRADSRVRTLSNGMQKRLSIARAILHRPQILILDEPEAGLDRESIAVLRSLLEEWTDAGLSVIMTTHDLDLGLSWARRAAVLSGGRIRFPAADEYMDGAQVRELVASALEPSR